MKLNFIIDKDYDTKLILHMLSKRSWEEVKDRSKRMGLDMRLTERIFNAKTSKQQKEILAEVSELTAGTYKTVLPYMQASMEMYRRSWDDIIEEFSATVEEITYPWFYDTYTCVVTHFNPGLSNWNGNIIGRWWKENPYTQRRITAHEILLAHYFSIHRNFFSIAVFQKTKSGNSLKSPPMLLPD